MSDPDSDLTPAQDDAVRALLAGAKHTEPTPAAVVARLDATLASLSEERRETRAPVVTLASRRRRTAATFVLAAAAVVVAGVGIGQVLPSGTSSDSDSTSAEAPASAGDRSSAESGSTLAEDDAGAGAEEKQDDADMRAQETAPVPSDQAFADLSSLSSDAALKPQIRKLQRQATYSSYRPDSACVPDAGESDLEVEVTYDDQPGAVVFRNPLGDKQRVDVFVCGEPDAVRSLTLRTP